MRTVPLAATALYAVLACGIGACGDGGGGADVEVAAGDDGADPSYGFDGNYSDEGGAADTAVDVEPEIIFYEFPPFDAGNYLDLYPKPDAGVDAGQDQGAGDPGIPKDDGKYDSGPVATACGKWADCALDHECDLSLGRCVRRDDVPKSPIDVFGFSPLEAAPGDLVVIDGRRFYSSLFGSMSVSVRVGTVNVPNGKLMADENRVVFFLPSAASGQVKVFGEGGQQAVAADYLSEATSGLLPCDGSTPQSTGTTPGDVGEAGPFAAGFVDMQVEEARLFYPALCGSVRRPPVPGQYPLVVLLHGNGAGWVGHSYLGQFLATWGFVSLMPKSFNSSYDVAPAETAWLIDRIDLVRGKDLGEVNPILSGVSTTSEVAMLGHSRGTARLGHVTDTSTEIAADTVASIFQGPVDDGFVVPGMFMVFGAGLDGQSVPMATNGAYARQPAPKWRVWLPGGNHGGFTDHKVWFGISDATPTITRHQQHEVVASFMLPLLQRAFGLTEDFPQMLDSPPSSSLYTVDSQQQ